MVVVTWGIALRGFNQLPMPRGRATAAALVRTDGLNRFAVLMEPATTLPGRTVLLTRVSGMNSPEDSARGIRGDAVGFASAYKVVAAPVDSRHLPPPSVNTRTEYRFGWPVRCLWAAFDQDNQICYVQNLGWTNLVTLARSSGRLDERVFVGDPRSPSRPLAMPTGLLPRGVATNTAFYASLWWIPLFGVPRVRRWNRIRRGLCSRCAYSLRGLDAVATCPECGQRP